MDRGSGSRIREQKQEITSISCEAAAFEPAIAAEAVGFWMLHQCRMKGSQT